MSFATVYITWENFNWMKVHLRIPRFSHIFILHRLLSMNFYWGQVGCETHWLWFKHGLSSNRLSATQIYASCFWPPTTGMPLSRGTHPSISSQTVRLRWAPWPTGISWPGLRCQRFLISGSDHIQDNNPQKGPDWIGSSLRNTLRLGVVPSYV